MEWSTDKIEVISFVLNAIFSPGAQILEWTSQTVCIIGLFRLRRVQPSRPTLNSVNSILVNSRLTNIMFQISVYVPTYGFWEHFVHWRLLYKMCTCELYVIFHLITLNNIAHKENVMALLKAGIKICCLTHQRIWKTVLRHLIQTVQELCLSSLLVAVAWADWVLLSTVRSDGRM